MTEKPCKKPMTGAEVRRVFYEAQLKRLASVVPPMTLEQARRQQQTMRVR